MNHTASNFHAHFQFLTAEFRVNDVDLGSKAFQALSMRNCRSMVVVNTRRRFHEALLVRGRAFTDRCHEAGLPVTVFEMATENRNSADFWPQPCLTFSDENQLGAMLRDLPRPVGVFVTIDLHAAMVHEAIRKAGLLEDGLCHLLVAGTTPALLGSLSPHPLTIEIPFRAILGIAVDRLVHRIMHDPPEGLTLLVMPGLLPHSEESESAILA